MTKMSRPDINIFQDLTAEADHLRLHPTLYSNGSTYPLVIYRGEVGTKTRKPLTQRCTKYINQCFWGNKLTKLVGRNEERLLILEIMGIRCRIFSGIRG